jgi:FHS family L-fucose permease-like MFS transporter
MFTLYFALFAAGRLTASWIQKRVSPAAQLALHVAAAILCVAVAMTASGVVAVAAVTTLGFFVSIFFPTLYALAIDGLGPMTGQASGLLTMGFVGCAVIPVLQGRVADTLTLQLSYGVAIAAYLMAGLFAFLELGRSKRAAASLSAQFPSRPAAP